MSRPVNWAPLAEADPVPGDEAEIRGMAKRYRDFAAELEEQAATLNRLAHADGWDAGAGRAFASTASEVGQQIQKAKGRYQAVGDALNSYVTVLAQSQNDADAALRQAQQIQQQAQADAAQAAQAAKAQPDAPQPAPSASGTEADPALSGPRRQMEEAAARRNSAARHAASSIRQATGHDGLKDSWWDKVKDWTGQQWDSFIDWVHKHAELINKIADWCSNIASVLAVIGTVLSFIPFVNALAPAFFAAAAVLTAVSLVAHLMTALSGDGSWIAVGLDVLGLVTFGVGRTATTGARAAQAALRGKVGIAAERAAVKAGEKAWAATVANRKAFGAVVSKGAEKAAASRIAREAAAKADQLVEGVVNPPPASLFINRMTTRLTPLSYRVDDILASGSKVTKLLGIDREVVLDEAGRKALAGLAPNYAPAKAALETLESKVKVAEIADGFGLAGDIVDKSKASTGYDKWATFGRYANQ